MSNIQFKKHSLDTFRSSVFKDKQAAYTPTSNASKWLKLKSGRNAIRLLPLLASGDPSFIETSNHPFMKIPRLDGSIGTVSPVCLEFLFAENEHCNSLCLDGIKSGKIIENDLDKAESLQNKYGAGSCPICVVTRKLHKIDKTKTTEYFPRNRAFTIVKDRLDNSEPKKLWFFSASITIWRDFQTQANLMEQHNIFVNDYDEGRDFNFSLEGQGRNSEYKGIMFSPVPSSFGEIEGDLLDLKKEWLLGVRGYNDFVDIVKCTPLLNKVAIEHDLRF